MSTDHIDAMLRKKAEKQLDASIAEAVGAFRRAVGDLWQGKGYSESRDARSMVLNAILNDPYEREHFVACMDEEAADGRGRRKAIESIHRHLAEEFLKKLDKLGEDVEELRDEVDFHSHN